MRKILALALAFAMILAVGSRARALDVERTVTGQGLTVLHVQRDNLPMVVFTLLINAGAVREDPELAGLASLTASLLEEGTGKRTSTEISEELEFIGARYSASAGMDYTTMNLTVLKKDLKKGFDVFADMLLNPQFPDEEVARVKELVKGSLKQREESPSFVARKAFLKEVYGNHPYGRIVQGKPETVDAIGREDIVEFHSTYFTPNNSILAVVGDISAPELDRMLKRYFGEWKVKPVPPLAVEPPKKPAHEVVKIDRDLTQANILLGHLGVSRDNPDYYALLIMNYILGGGGFSSRLMASVRDDMGLAYDVHSYFSPRKLSGSFEAGVQTKNSTANEAIAEILRQIRLMRDEKVSGKELEDAKAFLVGSYPRKFDTMGKVAGFLVQVEFFGLGLDYIEEYPELIRSVSEDDILRVAREYLDPENYVLVVVADQEKADVESAPVPEGGEHGK
jgi:zinc protease